MTDRYKPVGRAVEVPLWRDLTSWNLIRAPRPRLGPQRPERPERRSGAQRSGTLEYQLKFAAIRSAAERVGWTPADVEAHGVEGLDQALRDAGERGWSPRTISYYGKLLRYAGLGSGPISEPGRAPVVLAGPQARALWTATEPRDPVSWRTAALCRLAWTWPAPQRWWLELPASAISLRGGHELHVTVGTGSEAETWRLPAGGAEWARWLEARDRRGIGGTTALCTTRRSRLGHDAGSALSVRGFQAAFARHASACGIEGLSYERYRVAAIVDGAPVIGDRGTSRAVSTRAVHAEKLER